MSQIVQKVIKKNYKESLAIVCKISQRSNKSWNM